jgi:spore coat polysaccharide biosynthesis protein SpsF (cytidylyltransferase family)
MSSTPKCVAIIQARMSSSRFPGKVLAQLANLPLIVFMVERVRQARLVDQIVVATSTDPTDDPLAVELAKHRIDCFRGNLSDVLDRFVQCARAVNADHIVRLTGDCPLMDADLIDRGLSELAKGDADYVSNVAPPTYPDGLDVECLTMRALEMAWREATLPSEREHVTPYLRSGAPGIRVRNWSGTADYSALRWTVDHPDDLHHVTTLVDACRDVESRSSPRGFDRFDIFRAIEKHALSAGASHVRNEGLLKSLAAES